MPSSGARTRLQCCQRLAYVRDPKAENSGESEAFRDLPRREALDEVGRWASLLTCLAGDPTRENLAHKFIFPLRQGRLAFSLLFWGSRAVFHLNLGNPNGGTRQYEA
jgi:hypothetical protein